MNARSKLHVSARCWTQQLVVGNKLALPSRTTTGRKFRFDSEQFIRLDSDSENYVYNYALIVT